MGVVCVSPVLVDISFFRRLLFSGCARVDRALPRAAAFFLLRVFPSSVCFYNDAPRATPLLRQLSKGTRDPSTLEDVVATVFDGVFPPFQVTYCARRES